MLRRLFVGLTEGLVIGIALAVSAARGLNLSAPHALILALLAGGAGFVVGLVAGRPIWARDAKTEAVLKAGIGALIGAGLSFALGRWLSTPLDLSAFSLGAGPAGKLTAISLPLIAGALASFFELDNNGGKPAKAVPRAARGKLRFDASAEPDDLLTGPDQASLDELPAERKREKR